MQTREYMIVEYKNILSLIHCFSTSLSNFYQVVAVEVVKES